MTASVSAPLPAPGRPRAKGWCPGAYRPMMSGDGLIVRVRPRLARLTAAEARGIARAALTHGSGEMDLTSRANLQIRGVRLEAHEALLADLAALGLLDADPSLEERRNIMVDPLWRMGDDSGRIAAAMADALAEFPPLPTKFGFAIDAGETRRLAGASADIRVERGASGGLILRPDGADAGAPVAPQTAVQQILSLAWWFHETAGGEAGRMAEHLRAKPLPEGWATEAPGPAAALAAGATPLGPAIGAPFGRIGAKGLLRILDASGATAIRLAPGRLLVLEGGAAVTDPAFTTDAADPLLAADACPGAPVCAAATVETRDVARALAAQAAGGDLHVSGCAKGCARPRRAHLTLVGRDGRFDLVEDGLPWDPPIRVGLLPADLAKLLGSL